MAQKRIDEIIVHCAATREGKDFTVADIDRWHKQRGWKMIGYNYVVYRDGSVHEGRPLTMGGAHCVGHNSHSIGICYIGGCTADGKHAKDTRTPEQKLALRQLLERLHREYPKASIHGHNEFANMACPCYSMKEYSDLQPSRK